ncbi:MATE family efflux transporter [Anaerorhabdus sp.]|nr:MATE family efflux transporter [Anaerorhabdus sp.]MEA4875768.1 MATE family efflux transporter [Anaerorhabdus sp.]
MNLSKYIGDKAFMKAAIMVGVPLMLQQLITGSVNLVDNLMVGQLGDAAIGGVAAVNRFYIIAQYGANGIVAAGSIFIAQYFGARNMDKMKESFRFLLNISIAIMLVFFLLVFIFPEAILGFFTNDPAVIEMGVLYARLVSFSYIPIAITLSISGSMRSIGETKIPLFVSAIAVLINTFLNYCLIFGNFGFPQLGIRGAAYATLVARFIETGLLLYFIKEYEFDFKTKIKELFHVPAALSKKIMIKAAPLAMNEILWAGGMATLFKFYSTRGPEVMSGFSISSTIGDIFFVLFGGMAAASTVLISQPLGANKLEEGRRHGYQLMGFSFILSFIFATLMFIASFYIPYLYQNISMDALKIAENMLRIQSFMFAIYVLNTQNYFVLRAGGDTKSTLIMDSAFMWLINIPLVAVLAYFTPIGIYALYIAGQSTDLIKLAFGYWLVRKEKWVRNLTHEEL